MRGRKPVPSALNDLHGNPGHRRKSGAEVKTPAATAIPAPAHLSPAAAAEWNGIIAELKGSGILAARDFGLLEAWCSARGDFILASEALNQNGLVIVDRDGTLRRNPWVMVKAKAVEQLARIGSEFGLSPASRPRLGQRVPAEAAGAAPGSMSALDKFLASHPAKKLLPSRGSSLDEFLATDPDNPANQKRRTARH